MTAGNDLPYLRTEFLERVAHELRGPLGVTLGVLDEIELALAGDASSVPALMQMARRSARRLLRTADHLQAAAQLEAGKVEWHRQPSDVREIARSAAETAEAIAARRGIQVAVDAPAAPSPAALDATWVTLAVRELLVNAIRNARTRAGLHATLRDGAIRFVVTDDGNGYAGPVTDRFTPPPGRQGLGLSLAMVRDVAAAHEGDLSFEAPSEMRDSGACVCLTLREPQGRRTSAGSAKASSTSDPAAGETEG